MSQWIDVAILIQSELDRIDGEATDAAQRAQHPDAGIEHTLEELCKLIEKRAPVRVNLGSELFRFTSFMDWVNTARRRFCDVPKGSHVCIDKYGRICNSGKEFIRANREHTFPVVVYSIGEAD